MRVFKVFSILAGAMLAANCSFGVIIIVAPTTGVGGANPTNTIADAIVQVNAGPDVANTITLRSTEGPHILPDNTTWAFNAGKNCSFISESGQPVVVINWATGRYMLTITAGVNANNQTETLTFTGIAFIPETGLANGNNIADGINAQAGRFIFNNCVFSNNNGTNGVASQEGAVTFVDPPAGNNVGDDWIQFNTLNDATLSNCTVTGCNDDAVLFGGATAPEVSTLTLNQGTCIANVGGAGIQIFADQASLVLDGSAGRVLIANCGVRTGANDVGVKFFGDVGAFVMSQSDIINTTNGAYFDFSGIPSKTITDSRIALGNSASIPTAGNFSVNDGDLAGVGDSGATNQIINIQRSTFHDTLGASNDSFFAAEGANDPFQTFTIIDSIFSGAADSFVNMTNQTASGGPSPPVVKSFTAVVANGPHAIGDAGDLGASTINTDPEYVSLTYTIGRNQSNPDFLRPAAATYATASSTGTLLKGGAPGAVAGVTEWSLF